jgi:hypothetical protein
VEKFLSYVKQKILLTITAIGALFAAVFVAVLISEAPAWFQQHYPKRG